jgi:hypothetical protein
VLATVDFDHELCVEAGEVGEEWAEGNLAAETESLELLGAQPTRQEPLRVGGIAA